MFTCGVCYNMQGEATALHVACELGNLKVAETLITACASVNAQTKVSFYCNRSVQLRSLTVNVQWCVFTSLSPT